MTVNLKGVTRIVFILRNVVVKIPNPLYQWDHFLKGIIANINESKTWKYNTGKFDRGRSHLLCPVIWCSWGGWILVMKRAEELSEADWETVKIPEHRYYFEGDDTISNYGWLNGMIVKIDYGELDLWASDYKQNPSLSIAQKNGLNKAVNQYN